MVFLCLVLGGCREEERAPLYNPSGSAAGAQGGVSNASPSSSGEIDLGQRCEGPPHPDTSRLCGNQVVPVLLEKPNLYFVLDSSGSMNERINAGRPLTKMDAVQDALLSVTLELGHRIHYGLTAFPGPDDTNAGLLGCGPGKELFALQQGDPIECVDQPGGEVHDHFKETVRALETGGGTPLSSTLEAIAPTILAMERETVLVLMTDGAPNCNADIQCGVDSCIPNIEEAVLPGGDCDETFNCCDSSQLSEEDLFYVGSPEANCIDRTASLRVVNEFRSAGVLTYVIGVPGIEPFEKMMNELSRAGGTARGATVDYYDASDLDELTAVLSKIGASVARSCEVVLKDPPKDPGLLNVYFDAELVPADAKDGWTLEGDEVTFHGDSCDVLSSGEVLQVQLVSGCQTVVR